MIKRFFILNSLFIFFIVSNIFSEQNENKIIFSFNLQQDLVHKLASNNLITFDNNYINKIKEKNNLKDIDIKTSGQNISITLFFLSYKSLAGDTNTINRAFKLPYPTTIMINKYYLHKLMSESYNKIESDDLKNIASTNSNHLVNIEKNGFDYKITIEVCFNINLGKLSQGAQNDVITEVPSKTNSEIKIQNTNERIKNDYSTDKMSSDTRKSLEEAKRLAILKEQEQIKLNKESNSEFKSQWKEKQKKENETKRLSEEQKKLEEQELEKILKKKKEEEEKLELEEISRKVEDNNIKEETVNTEDYLKEMLFNRKKSELEDLKKEREKIVELKKNIDLNSIVLYTFDNKSYALSDYLLKSKGIILFCWTMPEGTKSTNTYLSELVYLQNVYKIYKKKGIEILSVYIPHEDQNLSNEEEDNVKKIIQRYKITYPVLVDFGLTFYDQIKIKALPTTFIINKNLKIEDIFFSFSKSSQNILQYRTNLFLGIPSNEFDKLKEEIFVISEKAYAYYKYGFLLYKLGDLDSAAKSLNKSLYITHNSPYSYNLMGIINTEKRDYKKAYEYFFKAISLDSTQAQFYSNLGYNCLEDNKFEDAKKYFQKALSINSKLVQAHYGVALVLYNKLLFNQAITEINTTLDLCEKGDSELQTKSDLEGWERLNWYNQQKCIYFYRYLILSLAGDESKKTEAEDYLKNKQVKDRTCKYCHVNDELKINYKEENKDLETYLKNSNNQKKFEKIKNNEFVHKPIADENCMVCHTLNKNNLELSESVATLCTKCHKDRLLNLGGEHIHAPIKDGKCLDCHDPHSTKYSSLLKEKLVDLCYLCHKEPDVSGRNHVVFKKGECVDCHVSHSSFNQFLVEDNLAETCFNCHGQEKDLYSQKVKHGPIKEGKCTSCHKIHGNKNNAKLEDSCFDCHIKNAYFTASTITLTYFRNGDFNLHEKHFNRMLQGKAMTCESCHEFHASEQVSLIRKGIKHNPRWGYTINFEKTPNGGKCVVGCHKPREYNRVKPLDTVGWK